MHQHGLTRLQGAVFHQVGIDRQDIFRQGGSLGQGQTARHGQQVADIDRDELGIAAAINQCANFIPNFPADIIPIVHRWAQTFDHTGDFQSQDRRSSCRRRIIAFPLKDIGPIDAGEGGSDQYMSRHQIRRLCIIQVKIGRILPLSAD